METAWFNHKDASLRDAFFSVSLHNTEKHTRTQFLLAHVCATVLIKWRNE